MLFGKGSHQPRRHGTLEVVDVSNAILGKPLPAVSTIDSSNLILEKGGLQEGWHGVLALGSEVSDIAPGDALTID